MLKLFNLVTMESPIEKVERYIRTAPKDVPITEDEIVGMIKLQ